MTLIKDFFLEHYLAERAERYTWLKANSIDYYLDMYNGHLMIYDDNEATLYMLRWGSSHASD